MSNKITSGGPDFLSDAIGKAVKTEVWRIAEEETKQAHERITERVRKEVDRIALNILAEYNIEHGKTNIIITVKKLI